MFLCLLVVFVVWEQDWDYMLNFLKLKHDIPLENVINKGVFVVILFIFQVLIFFKIIFRKILPRITNKNGIN